MGAIPREAADEPGQARAQGYREVRLVGLSLGGLGSLLYAEAYAGEVDGIVLLAPFLGRSAVVAEIAAAGGLARWRPPREPAADDFERRIWRWLREYTADGRGSALHLGYGTDDRFAPAHGLLAARLPADRVVARAGGHDWATWSLLWRELVAGDALGGRT